MKHKQKIKLARKQLSKKERLSGTPKFLSSWWQKRALARLKKQKKQCKSV